MCVKFSYFILTQNIYNNKSCKSCFNNTLQHQFIVNYCFGKL